MKFEPKCEEKLYDGIHVMTCNLGLRLVHEFLVSKETVVLRRWERSKQKIGSIKRVDKG